VNSPRLGAALLLTLCSACSYLTTPAVDPAAAVAAMLTEQQYQPALTLIATLDPAHPSYRALVAQRSEIANSLALFERTTAEQATQLLALQQWQQGQLTVALALEKNPLSTALLAEQQRMAAAVSEYGRHQQLQLAILRANYIPREKTLLNNIQRAQPATPGRKSLREQAVESRAILWRQAQQQAAENEWSSALESVGLVNSLEQTVASLALQRDIEQHLREQQQRRKDQKTKQKIDRLVAAVAADDLIAADIMAQGFSEKNQDQRLRKALRQLQLKIDRSAHYVQQLIDSGQKYYTEGLLDLAILSWQKALTLDPNNSELEQLLQRALLFQSNYQKLQKSLSQGR